MRYLMLVCLVMVGCSVDKNTTAKAKQYMPNELIALQDLPTEVIEVKGKIYASDKPNNEQRWFIMLEDDAIKTIEDDKRITVYFDSKDGEFSDSLRNWFKSNYKGRSVRIKGKAIRIPGDPKRMVYIEKSQVIF